MVFNAIAIGKLGENFSQGFCLSSVAVTAAGFTINELPDRFIDQTRSRSQAVIFIHLDPIEGFELLFLDSQTRLPRFAFAGT
jgi:hypothetical protein